jgi:hypothetical protein
MSEIEKEPFDGERVGCQPSEMFLVSACGKVTKVFPIPNLKKNQKKKKKKLKSPGHNVSNCKGVAELRRAAIS